MQTATVTALKTAPKHPPHKLTRDYVATLKPEPKPYEVRDTELKGFLVRVQPSGTKTYYLEIARGKRVKVGRTDALKVHIARSRAERIVGNVANGRDPWDGI